MQVVVLRAEYCNVQLCGPIEQPHLCAHFVCHDRFIIVFQHGRVGPGYDLTIGLPSKKVIGQANRLTGIGIRLIKTPTLETRTDAGIQHRIVGCVPLSIQGPGPLVLIAIQVIPFVTAQVTDDGPVPRSGAHYFLGQIEIDRARAQLICGSLVQLLFLIRIAQTTGDTYPVRDAIGQLCKGRIRVGILVELGRNWRAFRQRHQRLYRQRPGQGGIECGVKAADIQLRMLQVSTGNPVDGFAAR